MFAQLHQQILHTVSTMDAVDAVQVVGSTNLDVLVPATMIVFAILALIAAGRMIIALITTFFQAFIAVGSVMTLIVIAFGVMMLAMVIQAHLI